jgi:hypothetical protein
MLLAAFREAGWIEDEAVQQGDEADEARGGTGHKD